MRHAASSPVSSGTGWPASITSIPFEQLALAKPVGIARNHDALAGPAVIGVGRKRHGDGRLTRTDDDKAAFRARGQKGRQAMGGIGRGDGFVEKGAQQNALLVSHEYRPAGKGLERVKGIEPSS